MIPLDVDWLHWVNKPPENTPTGRTFRYLFGILPCFEETIQQEIKTEVDSGELEKLLKEGISLDKMVKGLLPLAPEFHF